MAHHPNEPFGFSTGVPRDASRFLVDYVRKGRVARWGGTQVPPEPALPQLLSEPTVRSSQRTRVEALARRAPEQTSRQSRGLLNRHDKKARSRLWHEVNRIQDQRAELISSGRKGCAQRLEVLAAMGSQCPADILKDNHRRPASLIAKCRHEMPERPESAGALSPEPGTTAGQRENPGMEKKPKRDPTVQVGRS